MSEHETDLRQGVTPTQHAVLDMLENQAAEWANLYDFEAQLIRAADRAKQAVRSTVLANKRRCAMEAAARLIDAADEIGRLIALDVAAGAAVSPPLYSTLEGLKRRAKQFRKETGCTHGEALNQLARLGGYTNFTHARRDLEGGAA